jgi:3-dehydroquinate synthase
MKIKKVQFSTAATCIYFNAVFKNLHQIVNTKNAVFITDENVFAAHSTKFKNHNTIVLKAGEAFKTQATVDSIIQQLIGFEADRTTTLIGVGGGVVTDITGFVASTYMRGLPFGFVPTTLLALVDASIGGKNGIDIGVYKNIVGVTKQPQFILQDISFLKSLSNAEWQNGFAEIIKHAAIKNATMFAELQQKSIGYYQKSKAALTNLLEKNAGIKLKIVQQDEFEKADRKLLNFGHTLGHALENQYNLSHGQAISIGMTYAAEISTQLVGFKQKEILIQTLEKYSLPTYAKFNTGNVMQVLKMDKKRNQDFMNYVLLQKIGKGIVKPIGLKTLENILQQFN